jgi:hypothetical protein
MNVSVRRNLFGPDYEKLIRMLAFGTVCEREAIFVIRMCTSVHDRAVIQYNLR